MLVLMNIQQTVRGIYYLVRLLLLRSASGGGILFLALLNSPGWRDGTEDDEGAAAQVDAEGFGAQDDVEGVDVQDELSMGIEVAGGTFGFGRGNGFNPFEGRNGGRPCIGEP